MSYCCYSYQMTEIHSRKCMEKTARDDVDSCKLNHVDRSVVGCWVCDERKAGR